MSNAKRSGEEGSARLKFIIVMAIIGLGLYAGYKYIPVAYSAYYLKDLMQHKVDVAATQGYQPAWVKDQLKKSASEYGIPPEAVITAEPLDQRIQVRVQFIHPIEFPGYTYEYEFDHTAKSTEFLTIK